MPWIGAPVDDSASLGLQEVDAFLLHLEADCRVAGSLYETRLGCSTPTQGPGVKDAGIFT